MPAAIVRCGNHFRAGRQETTPNDICNLFRAEKLKDLLEPIARMKVMQGIASPVGIFHQQKSGAVSVRNAWWLHQAAVVPHRVGCAMSKIDKK